MNKITKSLMATVNKIKTVRFNFSKMICEFSYENNWKADIKCWPP